MKTLMQEGIVWVLTYVGTSLIMSGLYIYDLSELEIKYYLLTKINKFESVNGIFFLLFDMVTRHRSLFQAN